MHLRLVRFDLSDSLWESILPVLVTEPSDGVLNMEKYNSKCETTDTTSWIQSTKRSWDIVSNTTRLRGKNKQTQASGGAFAGV